MRKNGINKTFIKRITTIALSAILAAGMLAGCKGGSGEGGKDGSGKTAQKDPSELVYVADYIPMELQGDGNNDYISFYDSVITDNRILTLHSIYDEKTEATDSTLVEFDMETGKLLREAAFPDALDGLDPMEMIPNGYDPSEFATGLNVNRFALLPDGKMVVIFYVYANQIVEDWTNVDYEEIIYKGKYALAILDKDLNVVTANEIDPSAIIPGETNLGEIFADDKGNIVITAAQYNENGNTYAMALIDPNCEIKTVIPLQMNQVDNFVKTSDGKYYILYYDSSWMMKAAELNLESGSIGEPLSGMPDYASSIGVIDGDSQHLLISSDDTLYKYSLSEGSMEEVLNWADVDIQPDSVQRIIGKEDGSFYAVLYSWNSGKTEIAKLYQKKRGEIAEKKEIVVASLWDDYQLSSAAIEFNKANPDYHITIKEYYNWENEDADLEDARKTLINDLGGAADIDIVNLEDFSIKSLVKQNVIEDITPFLSSGGKLNLSDYNESILNCYRYDGKLVAVPKTFQLMTLAVRSDLFKQNSWTVKEMIEYDKAHPDSVIMDYSYRMSILETCLYNNMDYFVDPDTGECRFDSEEFKQILEYASSYPKELDWDNYDDSESDIQKIQSGKVIAEPVYLYDLQSVQEYTDYVFQGNANFIGYPTITGEAATILQPSNVYGICSSSKNKEDAWKFIEFVLTREGDRDYGFPANNKDLQKQIDEELKKAGQKTGGGVGWGDGEVYEYHYATQEEIDLFFDMLGKAKLSPTNGGDQEIFTIIEEEIESYFSGQKSVDDVAKVIQSRVNLYVKENM